MRVPLTRVYDAALAGVVVAVGLAETWVPLDSLQGDGSSVADSVVVVVAGTALAWRRVRPLPVALVVLAIYPLVSLVVSLHVLFFGQFVPMAMAVFATARYGRGRVPVAGAVAGALALLFVDLFVEELQTPSEILFHWGVFTVVWLFGFGLARSEHRALESTRRAVAAEVASAEQALAAVLEERSRIARELHDIVAHAVSVMVVQAGAAEQVVEDDPAFARRALEAIRTTGTSALTEMRRVVSMLREDDASPLAPAPGLTALPALVEDAGTDGLTASLDVTGQRRDLPAGLDLAAYRIVQEALTNVRRHARASSVAVAVAYGSDEVRISVVDDGVGALDPRGGNGLVGMRERAALYGGSLETCSGDGRGFEVRAVLPLGTAT